MKYHICHKFGGSTDFNTYEQHPWHGAGQGTADTALQYIVLSDTMIDAYHLKIVPYLLQDPTSLLAVTRSLKAFINNVVIHTTNNNETDLQLLQQKALSQLQWWDKLVQVMGSALKPKKCDTFLYLWTPDKQGIL